MNNDHPPGPPVRRRGLLGWAALLGLSAPGAAMSTPPSPAGGEEPFTNPVLPGVEAGDPWVVWHDGRYHLTATFDPDGGLWVYSSDRLSDWRRAERRKVWTPEPHGPRSKMIWAPELHLLDGRWYLYFTASDGVDANHRHYVLEAPHPWGPFTDRGVVHAGHDRYAIDGSVLRLGDGRLYWMYADDGLWIAPMASPTRATGPGVRIAWGQHDWERAWHHVDGRWQVQQGAYWIEAPQALQRHGRDFVVYSAGHTAAAYCLGLLELIGPDPLDPKSWAKHPTPLLGPSDTVHAPGHCSFTRSPDGREDWLVYHAKDRHASERTVRIQRFGWAADGRPHFGAAIASGVPQRRPSGEA